MPNATITTGGTAQTLYARGAIGQGVLAIRNNSTQDLWLDIDSAAAVDDGLLIKAGEYWESPGRISGSISVIGATTGNKFWHYVFKK